MDYTRRIHIVPIRREFDRVVDLLQAYRADCVYLLVHEADHHPLSAEVEELVTRLETAVGLNVATVAVDQYDVYDVFGMVTTLADAHEDDSVSVNVSAGTIPAAIGATLGCMDVATDASAYYVPPDEQGSADATTGTGTDRDPRLPTYPIDSPSRDQVVLMVVIAVEAAGLSRPDKRSLIEAALDLGTTLDEFGFGHEMLVDYVGEDPRHLDSAPSFTELSKSQKNNAYRRLDRHLEPLVERRFVNTHREGRHRHVELTDRGRDALRAFRHKALDAVAEYGELNLPDWLDTDAEPRADW